MKKLILGTVLITTGLFSFSKAQIQKGNWMVGGNIISSEFGLNTGGAYNFSLQPKAAYFVDDNLAIGGLVTFGFSGSKDSSTKYTYNIGALGRYYFNNDQVDNLLKHGRFFVEGNLGIGGTSFTKGGNSTTGLNLGVGPGYAYFITPNVAIEGLVKYNGDFGFGNNGTTSNIGFNVGFQIYLPTSKVKKITRGE
ncbi:outer membrane beta-barrel protein (plasmid) [Elizabethkingia anophelis]|uniref:porin family protein n=1 Tax=Elizabethkingia anophelis TaxID=1117645 RepID=UPI0020B7CB2F|nr:porin family protein [Elizabethkingia anophelis]UTG66784.1 outer membrane beta-barrel protein [Elizabethkingia anophelis]